MTLDDIQRNNLDMCRRYYAEHWPLSFEEFRALIDLQSSPDELEAIADAENWEVREDGALLLRSAIEGTGESKA